MQLKKNSKNSNKRIQTIEKLVEMKRKKSNQQSFLFFLVVQKALKRKFSQKLYRTQ